MTKLANAFFGNDGADNFGGKIARPGIDVYSANALQLLFSGDQPIMGLAEEGSFTIAANPTGTAVGTYMFAQDYGYIPFVLVTCTGGPAAGVYGNHSMFAWFVPVSPPPTFLQVGGFITNVQSDRLFIRNIISDASQTFGVSVFWQRID